MSRLSEAVHIELIRAATEIVISQEVNGGFDIFQTACKFLAAHFALREPMTEEQKKAQYEHLRTIFRPAAPVDKPVIVEDGA